MSSIVKSFKNGDLMYGISMYREKYLSDVENYHKCNPTKNNIWARRRAGRADMSMVINSYNDPVRSAIANFGYSYQSLGNDESIASCVIREDRLNHAIKTASLGRPQNLGFDFESYQNIAIKHSKLRIMAKHSEEYLWWKRGSKSGIEMIAQQPETSTRKIHFILDGISMEKVVDKSMKSITSSELRYIFRHWHRLKGRVIFYYNDKVSPCPWESINWKHIWNKYIPKEKLR